MLDDGVFDDAFASARFSDNHAKSTLLCMNFDGLEDGLLMGEQCGSRVVEGVKFDSEV